MFTILSTKLFIPQITENLIKREGLLQKFTAGCSMNSHLTLVCAPAGYGKTTVLLEFIKAIKHANAWISLDEDDNDTSRFLSYLIASLKKAGLPLGNEVEYMVRDVGFNSVNTVLTAVINSIAAFSDKINLILDDYHFIRSQQVNEIVKFLLQNQPPNLHVIILTREDPQLPLSRLRVKGRVTEIRMGDLSFSKDESEEFFLNTMSMKLSSEAIEKITSKTEGWIAGMQLAALLFKDFTEEMVEEVIQRFGGSHSYIIDYLVEEVLERQPQDVKEFLYKTSVLERMNGEVCNAITERSDSRDMLNRLEKANLFLIPLDSAGEWYRYHHLFADSLRASLSIEEERQLYKRAAIWMKDKGFSQEAVRYAFKSEDMELALRLVEESTAEMFQNAQLETLLKWLQQLPEDMVKNSEVLAVRKSIALFITGKVKEGMEHVASLGEDFEQRASKHNKGLIFSLRALIAANTEGDAEPLANEALRLLEPWDFIARTSMLNTLGRALYQKGRMAEAMDTYKNAFESGFKMGYTFVVTLALMNYCKCLDTMGYRQRALSLCSEYMEGMKQKFGRPLPFIGIIYIAYAELLYESNELAGAKDYLEQGIELCKSISYNWLVSSTTLANIRFGENEKEEASDILRAIINETDISVREVQAIGVLTQQLLRRGRIKEAEKLEDKLKVHLMEPGRKDWEEAALAFARLQIHKGLVGKAEEMLLNLEEKLRRDQKQKPLITVYILLAEVYYNTGDKSKSEGYISEAVELAAESGYKRSFIDEEPLVWDALKLYRTSPDTRASAFVQELLKNDDGRDKVIGMQKADSGNARMVSLEFGETLSSRELEILTLIGQGMSNGDIAKALYVTVNTVQWHTTHIFSKLEVKTRTQAVIRAKELGIL